MVPHHTSDTGAGYSSSHRGKPASCLPAKWEHLFAWYFHGFHGQRIKRALCACVCERDWLHESDHVFLHTCVSTVFTYMKMPCVYLGMCTSVCARMFVCVCACAFQPVWPKWLSHSAYWANVSFVSFTTRQFWMWIHSLALKSQWHNTFWRVLFIHQSGSLSGQRLHWTYCALHWHECLLDRFIHLRFSPG